MIRVRHKILAMAGLACAALGVQAQPRPAVIELFTSEGCSSCPPAEALIGELAQRPTVLALSFHVDYWDNLGWRDRFGIAEATPRQRQYAKSLALPTVYTPQAVIDGERDFVGSDRRAIEHALGTGREGVPVAVSIHDDAVQVVIDAATLPRPCEVTLVAYQRSAVSSIGRGENSGRTLVEWNIVRAVRTLGRYTGTAQTYQAPVASLPGDATDIAVLVQTEGLGPIVAASHRPIR